MAENKANSVGDIHSFLQCVVVEIIYENIEHTDTVSVI